MAVVGQTSVQFVHWWHSSVVIKAFLFSLPTIIALEGHTFSQSLQPMQADSSTFFEKMANLPKVFCNAPKGQIKLWNTSGLYINVTKIETANHIINTGRLICSILLDRSIIATLITRKTQGKIPFFNNLGVTSLCKCSFFESHSTGIITVFIGQA